MTNNYGDPNYECFFCKHPVCHTIAYIPKSEVVILCCAKHLGRLGIHIMFKYKDSKDKFVIFGNPKEKINKSEFINHD